MTNFVDQDFAHWQAFPLSFAILTACSKYEFGGPLGLMVAVQMPMRKWADEVEARVI